ncbi:hypothetical protein BV898_12067 [Hypsibius exemplaris]|nr:hypothetical protein BV898_12067 [Hypsibius exemplaris]
MTLCHFNEEIAGVFGYILFFSFALDQTTLMGTLAEAIARPPAKVETAVNSCFFMLLFGCYSLAFFWPMVQVYDEDSKFYEVSQAFYLTCEQNHILVMGAGFFYFTRRLIANSMTFAASFGIVVYGIIQKSLTVPATNISQCNG